MTEEGILPKKKISPGAIVAIIALLLVSGFAWRVLYYAGQVRSGKTIDWDAVSFSGAFSKAKTTSAPLVLPGDVFDVASADDPSLGVAEANVTIVEFGDFFCPFSAEASSVARRMAAAYGDRARFVFRDFPIEEIHPGAMLAHQAANCALAQGKFWEYHDKVFQNQSDLSLERLQQFASELDFNLSAFDRCLAGQSSSEEIQADLKAGVAAGVEGTPTFFFNGHRIEGSIPEETFEALLKALLASE